VKKDVKSKVVAKNSRDGGLIPKLLAMTIQMNLVKHGEGNTNSPELSLLKIFPNTAISWLPPWISHLFHTMAFFRPHLFFTVGLDIMCDRI